MAAVDTAPDAIRIRKSGHLLNADRPDNVGRASSFLAASDKRCQWSQRVYNNQQVEIVTLSHDHWEPQETPRPMTEFMAESDRQTAQPSPVRRTCPEGSDHTEQQSKILFCFQKIDSCSSAVSLACLSGSVMRRHCGSRKANGQAPRSLARRWLGSRYPSSERRALTSSHVLAALVQAALRNPHISREERSM